MASQNDFLGSGWAFPVDVDKRGRLAMARNETDVEQSIRMILLTPKGQRIMRPEFGCQIHELTFSTFNSTTMGLAVHYTEEALKMWEPRIRVLSVRIRPDPSMDSRALINIDYELRQTHDRRSLVFPFYKIPGEPGEL